MGRGRWVVAPSEDLRPQANVDEETPLRLTLPVTGPSSSGSVRDPPSPPGTRFGPPSRELSATDGVDGVGRQNIIRHRPVLVVCSVRRWMSPRTVGGLEVVSEGDGYPKQVEGRALV